MRSGILYLVLAVILAGTATWLHSAWRTQQILSEQLDTSKIDYYLSGFSLLVVDAEGNNRYTLSGEHFLHQRKTGKSNIYQPAIAVNTAQDKLTIIANKAEQHENGYLSLLGEVSLNKPESQETVGFELQTAYLQYSPLNQLIETDAEVMVKTTEGNEFIAVGMSSDLNTHTTRLKSNVHAEYMPATTE